MTYRAVTFRICLFLDFLKPLKIWCHLDNFYFHCFMGGTKGKNLKTLEKCQMSGIHIWESCSPLYYQFQDSTTMSLINKISSLFKWHSMQKRLQGKVSRAWIPRTIMTMQWCAISQNSKYNICAWTFHTFLSTSSEQLY